ncbi:MAG: NADPH-dependent FMN reductase [bacterium]
MTMTAQALKVLAISGSLRTGSYNRKALQVAKTFAQEAGAEVEEIDLRELDLPMYDGDIEARGLPENVKKLKAAIEKVDVLLIASPEYNYSTSGALKNAIDWASRGGNSLDGKVATIFGVSPGLFGTVRGQFHLRHVLMALNAFILPQPQVFIKNAAEVFDSDGSLTDVKTAEKLKNLVVRTLGFAGKLRSKKE